jgi:hypothetical protein
MGLGALGVSAPLFLRNGELLGHSPIRNSINYDKQNKSNDSKRTGYINN